MDKAFKIIYGTTPATREQLDAIEEIVVEQEVDHAWEARITIPVCIAEDGSWDGENDDAYKQNARVRVEAKIGEGEWVPLIDGRIVRQQPDYNASPGLSNIVLVVHDDISLLASEPPPGDLGNQSDQDLITALFSIDTIGEPPEIGEFPANPDMEAVNNLHGTRIGMLRELAQRYQGFHAYVLPGDSPGQKSKGYFKKFPDPPATGLPVMYLTGKNQNISRFNIRLNTGRAARFEGASLNMGDKIVAVGSAGYAGTSPAQGESVTSSDPGIRTMRLEPGETDATDVQAAADAAAAESGYTLSAEGEVLPQCYNAILRPYMMVAARVSNSRYSTDYVIQRVTHTLGRSEYTQSFSLVGNSVSPSASPSASVPAAAAAVAGAAAVSFNIQVDIF